MELRDHFFDIVIVGAGPAGCACALALSEEGFRIALIEKETFPRDKICGDAIPGDSFKAMDKIHPHWGKLLRRYHLSNGIQVSKAFFPNGKTISLQWQALAYNSPRINFDHFLFDLVKNQTDTTVIHETIHAITVDASGVQCHLSGDVLIKASLVIGCDGATSMVRRQLLPDDSLKETCAAVRTYVKGVKNAPSHVNEFHFFKHLLPGYFWIFPVGNDTYNVGFGMLQSNKGKNKKELSLRNTLEVLLTKQLGLAERFSDSIRLGEIKGYGLPLGIKKIKASGERFMLCGDAASLIDPLQGHGIDKALWSGYYAAQQAEACMASGNFSAAFLQQYDDLLNRKIGNQMRRNARIMKALAKYPYLISLLTGVFHRPVLVRWAAKALKL